MRDNDGCRAIDEVIHRASSADLGDADLRESPHSRTLLLLLLLLLFHHYYGNNEMSRSDHRSLVWVDLWCIVHKKRRATFMVMISLLSLYFAFVFSQRYQV